MIGSNFIIITIMNSSAVLLFPSLTFRFLFSRSQVLPKSLHSHFCSIFSSVAHFLPANSLFLHLFQSFPLLECSGIYRSKLYFFYLIFCEFFVSYHFLSKEYRQMSTMNFSTNLKLKDLLHQLF